MADVKLSPPWQTFANEVRYTYGASHFVEVSNLEEVDGENYVLKVRVRRDIIANSLRQVIPMTVKFGNVIVSIIVYNSKGEEVPVSNQVYTLETLAELFCTALSGNPLFIGTVIRPASVPPSIADVTVVIKKSVIQFWNDDISDLCGNFNEVAASVFEDVSNLSYPVELKVAFSTFDYECKLQKNYYCPMKCDKCHCRKYSNCGCLK